TVWSVRAGNALGPRGEHASVGRRPGGRARPGCRRQGTPGAPSDAGHRASQTAGPTARPQSVPAANPEPRDTPQGPPGERATAG
ncbi:unnamed protein product, partial [Ixodes persulcatus]